MNAKAKGIVQYGLVVGCLCVLLVVWPNVVHEPLHVVALWVQGVDGSVAFDWSFPASPTTTPSVPLGSVGGALLFQLFPSVVSVVLLGLLLVRVWWVNEFSHFVLPVYLGFDLVVNIRGFMNPVSDFRVLRVLPWWVQGVLVGGVVVLVLCVVVRHRVSTTKCLLRGECGVDHRARK